ncbi:hypothetical protein TNCV_2093271 [Trichonephila clavipes]|nr:hypothetical protein TNCV_2093271 [Trichonephila clavipes]
MPALSSKVTGVSEINPVSRSPPQDAPGAGDIRAVRHYPTKLREFLKSNFRILYTAQKNTWLGWCRYARLLRSSGIMRKSFGIHKIRFQILIPHPETHTGLTFDASARVSSVARGKENPDAGLE